MTNRIEPPVEKNPKEKAVDEVSDKGVRKYDGFSDNNNHIFTNGHVKKKIKARKKRGPSDNFTFKEYWKVIRDLCRFARKKDLVMIAIGFIVAIINGTMMPLMSVIFGDTADTFLKEQSHILTVCNSTQHRNASVLSRSAFDHKAVRNCLQSRIPDEKDDEFMNKIQGYTLRYLLIFAVVFLTAFTQIFCWECVSENVVLNMRKAYLSQLLRQDVEWFDKNVQGDLSSKLTDDLERMRDGLGARVPMIMTSFSLLISGQVVAFLRSWRLSLVLLPGLPLISIMLGLVASIGSKSAQREQLRYGVAGGIAAETMSGIRTVSAFGAENRQLERYEKALDEGRKETLPKHYILAVVTGLMNALAFVLYSLGLWYGVKLYLVHEITPGEILTIMFCILQAGLTIGTNLIAIIDVNTALGLSYNVLKVIKRIPKIDPYASSGIELHNLKGKIEFCNVKFSYPTRMEMQILKGINITLEPGEILAFVGTSGGGKSTIVNLLMRFYDPTDGKIMIDGVNLKDLNLKHIRNQIGVVSQEPVLFDYTIAENIGFGKGEATMEEIVTAAKISNAHNFIVDLPQGYDTVVGERGTQLSGGQKQRVAIARAIVKNPKILLLDEATSALDSESEASVQAALDNAMSGRTTIIIAHRLSTVKNAHTICVVKDGLIAERGTHASLIEKQGLYYNLLNLQDKSEETKSDEISMESLERYRDEAFRLDETRTRKLSVLEQGRRSRISIKETSPNKISYLSLLKIKSVPIGWIIMTAIGCIVSGFCVPAFSVAYSAIVEVFVLSKDEFAKHFQLWIIIILTLAAFSSISNFFGLLGLCLSTERMIQTVRMETFKNIISQQVGWFDNEQNTTIKLTNCLSKDPPQIKAVAGPRFGSLVTGTINLTLAVGIAFYSDWRLASIICLSYPILVFCGVKQSKMRYINYSQQESKIKAAAKLASECIQNIKTVQQLGIQSILLTEYDEAMTEASNSTKKHIVLYGLVYALSSSIMYLMYSITYKYGASLIVSGTASLIDIFRLIFAVSFTAPLVGLACNYAQDFVKGKEAVAYLFKLKSTDSTLNVFKDDGTEPDIQGQVEFKNVEFSYPVRKSTRVLKGLNLTIEAGQRVALVGKSGSGKSTTVSLLERFYDVDRGKILIDGENIENISVNHLRKSIGLVTQEPVLFDCSIKDNIAIGCIAHGIIPTDQEIFEAAKTANIHNFILTLPQGYETQVGERGAMLSGGQKQRLAIARALIRNPKILLLDEATSALDNESEKVVQDALDRASEGRTTIVIAHRLSTIQNADSIAVIHNGRVVEKGTHYQLVQLEGHYYNMIKNQQF